MTIQEIPEMVVQMYLAAQPTTLPGRRPARAATDTGGAIPSLEASLAAFVSDAETGLNSERLDAQPSSDVGAPGGDPE